MIKLYAHEWLCYIKSATGKCRYWVLRRKGVSPLYTKHKVKKRNVVAAVSLFQNHPDGIQRLTQEEFNRLPKVGKQGANWKPNDAIDNYAESVDNTVDNIA